MNGEWKMKVRFVGREYKWAEHREDLFSPGAKHSAGRMKDFLALKMDLETLEADTCTARLQSTSRWWWSRRRVPRTPRQSWKGHRHCVATTTSIAREACSRSELGGTRGQNSRGQNSCEHDNATVLLERNATRCIGTAHDRHPWCSDSEWTRTIHQ